MTTPDTEILAAIRNDYSTTAWFNKFPQTVKLNEPTPKILVLNITQTTRNTKDKIGREEYLYRVEVIGTRYMDVFEVANDIKATLINYTGTTVYLVDYDGGVYDTDETAEIHRIIKDYRVFIHQTEITS